MRKLNIAEYMAEDRKQWRQLIAQLTPGFDDGDGDDNDYEDEHINILIKCQVYELLNVILCNYFSFFYFFESVFITGTLRISVKETFTKNMNSVGR